MRFVFIALAAVLLAGCDAGGIDACKPGDNVICGIDRPEDLEIVPGTRWLMVSELGSPPKPGRILLVDPATKEVKVLDRGNPTPTETETFPRCGKPPEVLHPGGFHLSAAEDGSLRLVVINHTDRARVERYRVTVSGDDVSLQWEGCVDIPKDVAPNDIASIGDSGFVLSHMYPVPRDFMTNIKLILGMNTGAAYRWTRDGGWFRIPHSDASFGNGIQFDPKTKRVYLASMFNQRILAFDLDGGNAQTSERIPVQNDNLSWSEDGKLIGVGHTGFPVIGTQPCKDLNGKQPCGFPFVAFEMDPKTLAFKTIYTYEKGDKGNIPGASTAILKDGTIYLGTAFGDRVTIVKPN